MVQLARMVATEAQGHRAAEAKVEASMITMVDVKVGLAILPVATVGQAATQEVGEEAL